MLVARSNMHDINVLKIKLANSFAMNDLGVVKQILGMRITRDKKNHKLTLSQDEYIEKVLHRFRMKNEKPVSTPLDIHFKPRICVPRHKRDKIHVQGSLLINGWKLDVCHGVCYHPIIFPWL